MSKVIITVARTLIILSGLVLLLGQVLYFPLMGQELAIHLLGILSVGGPGVLIILTTAIVGGAMFTVLMLVMRGLLRRATEDRMELAEVV